MKYYIIAGEASGDLHGSNLMKGLYAQDPSADIRFWGGDLMNGVYKAHQAGKGLVRDYRATAVMGFWEVLLKGASIARNVRDCKADMIDYPGFNLKIAEFAHEAGFKVYYYIAPKVWASREGRIRKIKAWVDRLFIIFPFEIPYFESKGVPFTYAGNPLVDAIDQSAAMAEPREAFFRRTGVPDTPYIALLAGSRNMEIGSMMPTFMQFADVWHAENPSCHFVVAAAPSRTLIDYDSGTASLEAALIGTPQIVGYQMAALTAFIARRIVKVPYVSLANLIINRLAFKEFLLENFTLENLVAEMRRITEDAAYRQKMLADYAEVRQLLGGTGASTAVAKAMVESLM